MSFKSKFALTIWSASLAAYPVAGAWLATRAEQPANDPGAQQRIFESVLQHIQNDYVDEPNMEKVRAGALRGLAYGLDPYSTYLTPDQVKDYRADGKSKLVGIGAELSQVASFLYVVAPVKGSPADQAGVRAGDIIEYIDGKATRDISLYDARQLLNGAPGSEVKLRILRARAVTLTVKRGSFHAPAAETIGRSQKVLKTFEADPKVALFNGPVNVLIDNGTAGAAEIVASAFLEHKRGDVVGERSFGAGAEQQLFTLRDGDGLLLTTVKWASSSGKPFLGEDRNKSGVAPSVEVKKPDNLD